MLSVEEALHRVLALASPLEIEEVPIARAINRFAAHAVVAHAELPAFANSAMDGYAVMASDLAGASPLTAVALPIALEASAGSVVGVHQQGTATRIFTGAPLPLNADSIVMQELTTRTENIVSFTEPPTRGAYIRDRGSDIRNGQLLIAIGTRMGPTELAVLASQRMQRVAVHRRPNVALLLTGDEVMAPEKIVTEAHPFDGATKDLDTPRATIPDTNGPMLTALLEGAECNVSPARYVPDRLQLVKDALDQSLATHDVVVSVGGVSVGDHDYVAEAARQVGAEVSFWKVAMKPGKPLLVCRRGKSILFGLPGNPVSAFVTYHLFVRSYLQAIAGSANPEPQSVRAELTHAAQHAPGRDEFVRARLKFDRVSAYPQATLNLNQGSGALSSLLGANALVRLGGNETSFSPGSIVTAFSF